MKRKILLFIYLVTLLSIISCFGPNLPAPTNVYATQGTYNDKIVITWDGGGDPMTFNIYRKDNNSFWSLLSFVYEKKYEDYDIEVNKIYYYVIRPIYADYAGEESSPPVSGWAGTIREKRN